MKSRLVKLLEEADFEGIMEIAARNKRVLSWLTAQTYHPNALVGWRAVQAFGMAAQRIAEYDAEYVRNHLRRQFWLVNDESGGIGWRAPELIGETLARCSGLFEEFVSPLVYLLDMEKEDAPRFRVGTLWAIGRLSPGRPQVSTIATPLVLPCLHEVDPQVRGMALYCLDGMDYRGSIPGLRELLKDKARVEIYRYGELQAASIGVLAEKLVGQHG